jgi:hypothetical protein
LTVLVRLVKALGKPYKPTQTLAQQPRRRYDQAVFLNPAARARTMSYIHSLHRREFARQCLGGIGAASLTAGVTAAETPPPPALPEDPPHKLPPPEALLLTLLMAQYPSPHYTDDNLQSIYGDIAADLSRSRQLRAFPLTSGDAPAAAFRVYRATEGAE